MWGRKYVLRLLRCSSIPRCKQQTRVISPSVVLLKSFMQFDSSLLRGSRGGSRRRALNLQKCEPRLSPPGRAALIRHGASQKRRTAPPSPRGRLCAPSASLSTAEPRFAPYIPRRSPKQTTKNPAEPGFCFNIRCGYSFSPDRPRRFRGSGYSYPCLFRTWFLPPYRS